MEVIGKIKFIGHTEDISSSFSKRDIVVTTEEQYPQHILIQFVQDKCNILDKYKIGESVKISINLRGREWVSPQGEIKYFNTIQGWRIEKENTSSQNTPPSHQSNTDETVPPYTESNTVDEDHDDLPF